MKKTTLPDGVYVAALTPMHKDLTIDADLLFEHCQYLMEAGAQGLALMGTTGEANSFSLQERKSLVEKLMERGVDSQRIMLGTGCCALSDTVELTRHAVKNGIRSILLLPPFYYKQITEAGLYEYFKEVVHEVGADDLEIYLYHIPKMTGLDLSFSLIERLISDFPNNFVGMKDSGGDFAHMKEIRSRFNDLRLFAGTEKYLLDILQIGGAGCISATANVTVGQCMDVYNHWQEASAGKRQEVLTSQRVAFEGFPFIGILKPYLAKLSGNTQWLNIRPPNSLVEESDLMKVWMSLNKE